MIVKRSSSRDRVRRSVEGGRIRRRVVRPVRRETVEVVVREDVLQRRQLLRHVFDLGELLGVLADDPDRFGVRQEVSDVARRARGVHGDADGTDVREREVEERPVEAVAGQERDVVALAHAAREEAVRVRAHALVGVGPRHLATSPLPTRRGRRGPRARLRPTAARAARSYGDPRSRVASRGRLRPSRSRSELRCSRRKGFGQSRAKLAGPDAEA